MNKDKKVQQIITIEGIYNFIVLILKTIVGFTTGSLAVLSDAVHSLTDVLNNVVIWMVMRVASKPPDYDHPYGHRKFETIAVFALASLLVVLAVELIIRAFSAESEVPVTEPWALGLMLVVLLMNITVTIWERYWAKKLDSAILLADAQHTLVDVLTTIMVIASWQLAALGWGWIDKLAGIGVAAMVLYFAYGLYQKVFPILVDGYAIDPDELSKTAAEVPGVLEVRQVRSRWIGSKKAVDMRIAVAADLPTVDAHDLAHRVEDHICERFNIVDTSIHVEPYLGKENKSTNEKNKVKKR
ncbi:cation diffusion facilitator family transporter [Marinicella gelatinilytica]|uniref:cation diffusion facilitator family transporter n=1 Tax=Marinicella gelatinilytica TaxID=2996017 RepID=UPI002260A864|nr:cation diffusion facilitator family transporter [Marinicella gelatinilytica]MCX7544329.1 cation diffusion facilitator family transporter [Marinicella gelatinilytica]